MAPHTTQTPTRHPADGADADAGPHRTRSAQALAGARRLELRMRARRIRRAVVGGALALFAAAFLAIYAQLATGHDPALSTGAARRATVASTAGSSPSATRAVTSSSGSAAGASHSSSSASEGASTAGAARSSEAASSPPSLTTAQS